ncbi:MAG: glucokinase [Deltaproteobacteria bacterium]|nr:glucokinase [Deltaproteobacteria bacterium]
MILAGDIGGTHARIATFTVEGGRVKLVSEQIYPSHEHHNLESALRAFLTTHSVTATTACFGVAGPVHKGIAVLPNLGWTVDASSLAHEIGIERARVINDLEANAYGIAALDASDLSVINPGAPNAVGNAAVISAGTGLGEAGLYWDGTTLRPFACEGGHADFAPTDPLGTEMLAWLQKQYAHVSWERVLSGNGLFNLYRFLRDTGRGEEPAWLTEELKNDDPPPVITRAALEKSSRLCEMALDLLVVLLGAEAANLALKIMATGGIYLGGGIVPRVLNKLKEPAFMRAFTNKGRMSDMLSAIPVKAILNDGAALLGAARCAALTAGLL